MITDRCLCSFALNSFKVYCLGKKLRNRKKCVLLVCELSM